MSIMPCASGIGQSGQWLIWKIMNFFIYSNMTQTHKLATVLQALADMGVIYLFFTIYY